ncbi:HAD-IIB family hydrolase [Candidatus Gottesmanbacteria bacterium]|nr:HAD-IIB family hydrolase [Candidatus Gottesmanbacteria bacterium]
MKYKALFLDLDGTTVPNRADGMPSEKVRNAIHKAKSKVFVCVATSRPLPYAKLVLDHLDIRGLCSVNDATQIYDPVKKKIIQTIYLRQNDVPKIVDIFSQHNTTLLMSDGLVEHTYDLSKKPREGICVLGVADISEELTDTLTHQLTNISTIAVHKVFSWQKKGFFWIGVTNATATKLHGIVTIAKMLSLKTEDTIGVGDGYNDYPLLSACGLKVAMGNAVPELKAIADFIAPTDEEDGVATVIEKFILNT